MSDRAANSLAVDAAGDCLWELFHENSKIGRYDNLPGRSSVRRVETDLAPPPAFRQYPMTPLPLVSALDWSHLSTGLTGALPASFTSEQLSTVLGATRGLLAPAETSPGERLWPRVEGAPVAFQLFVHCVHVEGLDAGLYYYDPGAHCLRLLRSGAHSRTIASSMSNEVAVTESEVFLFLAADFATADVPHGNRAYRLLLLDVGRLAQATHFAADRLNLDCVQVDYYFDREVDTWLGLDGVLQSTVLVLGVSRGAPHKKGFFGKS